MKYLPLYLNYVQIKNPKQDGFTGIKCPFHSNGEEKDASAGIDLKTGVFACKACGLNLAVSSFIAKFENIAIQEAGTIVDAFKVDNNIKIEINNFSKKYVFAQENPEWLDLYKLSRHCDLYETFAVDYARERGIDVKILKEEGIGFLPAAATGQFGHDSLVFPYFYGNKLVGLRFRDEEGSKSGLEDSLMVPWGIDTVSPFTKQIVVVEGESDRLRLLYELRKRELDYCVIAFPGGYFKSEWERDFVGIDTIVTIPDTDNGGDNLVKALETNFPHSIKVVKLPWQRRQIGKDLCDWCSQNETLINEFISSITIVLEESKNSGPVSTEDFLLEDSEEKETLITNLLMEGQIHVIAGKQKAKKTWLALNTVKTLVTPYSELFGIPNLMTTDRITKTLYIQTEGAKSKFKKRIKQILKDAPNAKNAYWWFKPGIKLDIAKDVKKLAKKIKETGAHVLILDPFQRLHTKSENDSGETGIVWDALFSLITEFPYLSIIVIHHFGKDGSIHDRFDALRGSSRMGGEVDGGWFIENKKEHSHILFELRDEESLETADGKDVFQLNFTETGHFYLNVNSIVIDKSDDLVNEIKIKKKWKFEDALTHYGIGRSTLDRWISKQDKHIKKEGTGKDIVIVCQ